MSKRAKMGIAGGIVAALMVVGIAAALMVYQPWVPKSQMTVKIGGEDSRALASSVGADGIAAENNGVYVGVVLYFDEVRLKDAGTGAWTTINAPGHMDIVALANHSGNTTSGSVLVTATIPQGTYDEIVLVLNRVTVTVEVTWAGGSWKTDVDAKINNHEVHLQGPITVDANGVIVLITFSITRSTSHNVDWTSGKPTAAFSPTARLSVVG